MHGFIIVRFYLYRQVTTYIIFSDPKSCFIAATYRSRMGRKIPLLVRKWRFSNNFGAPFRAGVVISSRDDNTLDLFAFGRTASKLARRLKGQLMATAAFLNCDFGRMNASQALRWPHFTKDSRCQTPLVFQAA
jgi:hypothetical protein